MTHSEIIEKTTIALEAIEAAAKIANQQTNAKRRALIRVRRNAVAQITGGGFDRQMIEASASLSPEIMALLHDPLG